MFDYSAILFVVNFLFLISYNVKSVEGQQNLKFSPLPGIQQTSVLPAPAQTIQTVQSQPISNSNIPPANNAANSNNLLQYAL
ncbi:hypothetical protein ACKWTF_013658 [Chironomus riparius]